MANTAVENSDALTQTEKPKKQRTKKSFIVKPLTVIAILCLLGYAIVMIITQQAQIVQLQQKTSDLSDKIVVAKQENDEYTRLLSENDEATYMERIAIEKLGYAYPDEKRFYIISGD